MALGKFALGIFVKTVTGFDDTITHVPILASVAKTRAGRIAFSLGTLAAVIAGIAIALFLSEFFGRYQWYRYVSAALVFGLAAAIYFDVIVHKPRAKAEAKYLKRKITLERFTKLFGIGFVASFATVLDDIVAYAPALAVPVADRIFVIAGIIAMTIVEILAVIFFSRQITGFKHTDKIASIGLVVLGVLILAGVV